MVKLAPPQINSFYYVLAQAWPRALHFHTLFKNRPLKDLSHWILHGLWIRSLEVPDLLLFDYSTSPHYKRPKNPILLNKLNVLVPNVKQTESNSDLLRKLYRKHGKCVVHYNKNGSIKTPEAYLQKAVDLAEKYNIGQYMQKFDVDKKHKLKEIREEISKAIQEGTETETEVTPNLNCLSVCDSNELVINQIYLCFDDKFTLRSCPDFSEPIDENADAWYVGCPHSNLGEVCSRPKCKCLTKATYPLPKS